MSRVRGSRQTMYYCCKCWGDLAHMFKRSCCSWVKIDLDESDLLKIWARSPQHQSCREFLLSWGLCAFTAGGLVHPLVGELKSHKPLGAAGEKKNRLGGKAGREMGDHVSVWDSSSGGKECGKVLDPSQTELAGLAVDREWDVRKQVIRTTRFWSEHLERSYSHWLRLGRWWEELGGVQEFNWGTSDTGKSHELFTQLTCCDHSQWVCLESSL